MRMLEYLPMSVCKSMDLSVSFAWCDYIHVCAEPLIVTSLVGYVHVLMRDEKEGRKKQARLNKQQGKAIQHTQGSHFS